MRRLLTPKYDIAGNSFYRVFKLCCLNKIVPIGNFKHGPGLKASLVLLLLHYLGKPIYMLSTRYERYVHNLKEKVLEPFLNNANFRRAVKDYSTDSFKTYDRRIREEVSYFMKNLAEKSGYTEQGAKEEQLQVDHKKDRHAQDQDSAAGRRILGPDLTVRVLHRQHGLLADRRRQR